MSATIAYCADFFKKYYFGWLEYWIYHQLTANRTELERNEIK